MFQILVTSDALQLVGDNLFHLLLDAPVIRLHHFLHAVVAVRVREVGNDGYRLVGFLLAPHLLCVLMEVETSCRLMEMDCRF